MTPVLGIFCASSFSVICGCAGVPKARGYQGDLPARVVADWNDIDAALSRATKRTETAIVGRTEVGSGEKGSRIRVEFLSIRDDQFWLEFEALESWPTESGPGPISISAGSLLPDAETVERNVVGEVVVQLEALAGKDVAPSN